VIDKKISIGSIITAVTIIGTFIFTQGSTTHKIEVMEKEQTSTVFMVDKNATDIVKLKIGVAKIETQLDDRFDRLEEIIMDLD
jgi:hypothetical protein|tara:strand:+ start:519 stop:767 length:249 start_codon:yes stop_codon:yes gene_type:complete